MGCPWGCLGGGGQPIPTNEYIRGKRAEAIYKEEEGLPIRKSHENPHVSYIYEKFLTDGAKVKVDVFFKGRNIIYKEKGEIILLKFAQALEEVGKVEKMPKLEGKKMILIIAPKKKK